MKKIITSSGLIIALFFIAHKSEAQTATAVKAPVTTKDTTASTKAGIKKRIPDPAAAVANQGTEVTKPIVIAVLKLPAVSDQNSKAKQ